MFTNQLNNPRNIRSSRVNSFSNCGIDISKATDLGSALRLAQLDWQVKKLQLFYAGPGGKPAKITTGGGIFRLSADGQDGIELGLCGTEFTPIQNQTSLEVCQTLAGIGAKFDRAGSENQGARNWVRMEVAEKLILGDTIKGFVLVRNSHLPGESFTARAWEERLICTNGMTALQPGAMLLNLRHTGQVEKDNLMTRARVVIEAVRQRLEELQVLAERAARVTLTGERWEQVVHDLLPIAENATDRQREVLGEQRSRLYRSINAPDLANFVRNQDGITILNGWAALNAVADFSSHLNDAQRKVSIDRLSARLTDLATKDDLLTRAKEMVLN